MNVQLGQAMLMNGSVADQHSDSILNLIPCLSPFGQERHRLYLAPLHAMEVLRLTSFKRWLGTVFRVKPIWESVIVSRPAENELLSDLSSTANTSSAKASSHNLRNRPDIDEADNSR